VTRTSTRCQSSLVIVLAACCLPAAEPDLKEYRTVDKAETVQLKPPVHVRAGYLGVSVMRDRGVLVVEEVQADSPAEKAGVRKGDRVVRIDGRAVKTADTFRELLQTRGAGESVKLELEREGKPVEASATLASVSRPMKLGDRPPYLGVTLGEAVKDGEGVALERVTPGSPAEAAGLKTGDRIVKLEGTEFTRPNRLDDVLADKKPGDSIKLTVHRDGKDTDITAKLGERGAGRGDFGRDFGPTALWKKEVFRLAVVGVDFADTKHNAKVPLKEWEAAIFSRGSYTGKANATGQDVHGSLADYLHEQSAGAFRLEGKVFDWVEVGKKRDDYVQGSGTSNKTAPLVEALEKLTARDGKDAVKNFDGFLFIYAGDRPRDRGNRGSLYYPHAGQISFQSKRSPYLFIAEGASKMSPVGAVVKEFSQVLGLPDLAARPENPGSEGLGVWCALSNPFATGRPQHLSAWAKEKLGWLRPAVIDPTVRQKIVLGTVEDSPTECVKVLVRLDGSEYFLLENRRKKGFDADLPAEGLLIWRVVHDRPVLEESHGVEGPTGPTVHLSAVPYPSASNNAFTPETTPSSRSPVGGGLPVHITEIHRLPDGRITFHVGYEYR
jgi:M6 family metalloprotease-like protein